MALAFVGATYGRPINVGPFNLVAAGGIGPPIADGDWLVSWWLFRSTMTETLASPTGWTQLLAGTGSVSIAAELWVRQWHTGDPTSWTVNVTGYVDDSLITTVWRDVGATPSIVAPLHFTTTSPAIADEIVDAGIGPNDIALGYFGAHSSTPDMASASPSLTNFATVGFTVVSGNGYRTTGVSGDAVEIDVPSSFGTPTEMVGTQIILAGPPGRFPLRLFPRNDDLDGPRLAQFHDSASRSTRLGAGSYD